MGAWSSKSSPESGVVYRKPGLGDGVAIHALVLSSKPLDANSPYSYLLLTAHFDETCVVAELDGEIVGYVSAYVHPKQPDTLFVWQVAVGERVRKRGVGISMLMHLLGRPGLKPVSWLETTVTPSNTGSARLFESLAQRLKTRCSKTAFFPGDLFEGQSHEEEILFRIGPFSKL